MSQAEPKAEWLYSRNGKTFGPLSAQQLRQLVVEMRIGPKDLVCRNGTDQWVAAGSLKGLFPAASAPPQTIEAVLVRPAEADRPTDAEREDVWWRSVGGWFIVINLAACALVGAIKLPPWHIAAFAHATQNLHHSNKGLDDPLGRTRKGLQDDSREIGNHPAPDANTVAWHKSVE